MGDTVREQPEEAPLDVAGAMAAARLLLAAAEADATRLREDAVRYARQREQEAELLVAKARRVLSVAEERAAGIVVAARTQSPKVERVVEAEGLVDDEVPRILAPSNAALNRLDDMLASAITHAVDRTFPPDE